MQTVLASVKKLLESDKLSLPIPLIFIPPKGMCKSRISQELTHTVPTSNWLATRLALCKFSV